MKHDPVTVAAYVAGDLGAAAHAAFEEHLLGCEGCWSEVQAGRKGRELAEHARESAPDVLRRRIVDAAPLPPRVGRRGMPSRRWIVAGLAAAACVVAILAGVLPVSRQSSGPVSTAVGGFLEQRLPGAGIPANPAPDLTRLGFVDTAAGTGRLAGAPVTAYAYRDGVGRRLLVYVAEQPFAMPSDAERYDTGGSWLTHERGVVVLCSRPPHLALVVGRDEQLVRAAAAMLDLA